MVVFVFVFVFPAEITKLVHTFGQVLVLIQGSRSDRGRVHVCFPGPSNMHPEALCVLGLGFIACVQF